MKLTPEQVQACTKSPLKNIKTTLPLIYNALGDDVSIPMLVATLATVATECNFASIPERGARSYFTRYEGRVDLGNLQPGDGFRFRGRGMIQLTGRRNYTHYGQKIGVDLVAQPELALEPGTAAKILVEYLREHGVDVWAARGHWLKVRKLVNGGTNGLDRFLQCVWALLDEIY